MPVEQAEVAERLIKRRVPWVVVFESRGEVWRGLEAVLAVPGNRHRVGAYIHSDWLKWALSGQADRGPFASSNSENDMLARRLSDASAALGARGDVGALEEVALERAIAANRCELARADDDVRDLEAAVAASRNSHERRSLRDALRHKTKERSRLRTSFFELQAETQRFANFGRSPKNDGRDVLRNVVWKELDDKQLGQAVVDSMRDSNGLALRDVLDGYVLNESLWGYDYGFVDADYGCEYDDKREMFARQVMSGRLNPASCHGCDKYVDHACRYRHTALRGRKGLIGNHPSKELFKRGLNVLFGATPDLPGAASRAAAKDDYLEALADYDSAPKASPAVPLQPVATKILDGDLLSQEELKEAFVTAKAHHDAHAGALLTFMLQHGMPASALLSGELRDQYFGLVQTRKRWRAILTIFEAGALYAASGRPVPVDADPIARPVINPPSGKTFGVFPDNLEAWRPHLEPLNANLEFIGWREAAARLSRPTKPKTALQRIQDALETLVAAGNSKPSMKQVADVLMIGPRSVESVVQRAGTKWPVLQDAARARVAARTTAPRHGLCV